MAVTILSQLVFHIALQDAYCAVLKSVFSQTNRHKCNGNEQVEFFCFGGRHMYIYIFLFMYRCIYVYIYVIHIYIYV